MVLNINKPIGITSYDVIRQLKKIFPGRKIGHAGTLDPLAEGVLICLTDSDTRKQAEVMAADKDYEFEVLFGFETDTFDILGFVKDLSEGDEAAYEHEFFLEKLRAALPNFTGEIDQTVPHFSAIKRDGVPMYRATLSGQVDKEVFEKRKAQVLNLEILSHLLMSAEELETYICGLLDMVVKGFRKDPISERWKEVLGNVRFNHQKFLLVKMKATVGKGTYVRSLAHDLGSVLGVGACTTVIKRTRAVIFQLENSRAVLDLQPDQNSAN